MGLDFLNSVYYLFKVFCIECSSVYHYILNDFSIIDLFCRFARGLAMSATLLPRHSQAHNKNSFLFIVALFMIMLILGDILESIKKLAGRGGAAGAGKLLVNVFKAAPQGGGTNATLQIAKFLTGGGDNDNNDNNKKDDKKKMISLGIAKRKIKRIILIQIKMLAPIKIALKVKNFIFKIRAGYAEIELVLSLILRDAEGYRSRWSISTSIYHGSQVRSPQKRQNFVGGYKASLASTKVSASQNLIKQTVAQQHKGQRTQEAIANLIYIVNRGVAKLCFFLLKKKGCEATRACNRLLASQHTQSGHLFFFACPHYIKNFIERIASGTKSPSCKKYQYQFIFPLVLNLFSIEQASLGQEEAQMVQILSNMFILCLLVLFSFLNLIKDISIIYIIYKFKERDRLEALLNKYKIYKNNPKVREWVNKIINGYEKISIYFILYEILFVLLIILFLLVFCYMKVYTVISPC